MKYFYGVLSLLGLVLPYSQFIPWIVRNGFDLTLLFEAINGCRWQVRYW